MRFYTGIVVFVAVTMPERSTLRGKDNNFREGLTAEQNLGVTQSKLIRDPVRRIGKLYKPPPPVREKQQLMQSKIVSSSSRNKFIFADVIGFAR